MVREDNLMRSDDREALYKGEAILRASKALSCFSPEKPRCTLDDLTAATSVPKETLLGILNTLVQHGMLRRTEDHAYQLGFAWLKLGAVRRNQLDIRTIAIPLMRTIRDAVNETVILTVKVGDQRVHIDYVESTQQIRRLAQIGSSGPLYLGAAGLALISTLPEIERNAYLDRVRPNLSTVEVKSIERKLLGIRSDGFAVAVGTVNRDAAAVSAAVRLYAGDSVAITVSCPVERFTAAFKLRCSNLLKEAIGQLSFRLGTRL